MVYINTQDTAPVIYIPSNGWPGGLMCLDLTARNTTDEQEVSIPITSAAPAGFLLRLGVEVPDKMHPGEWQYTLTADLEAVIATGLCKVYDGERPGAVQYKADNKVIQYDGN